MAERRGQLHPSRSHRRGGGQGIEWVTEALSRLRLFHPGASAPSLALGDRWAWLPPAIQEVWRTIGNDQPTILGIDSWDALTEAYLGPEKGAVAGVPRREELERILLRSMALLNAHLALVVERSEKGEHADQIDYLVDGVVDLSMPVVEGRMERWLRIPKLRGVQVEEREYPFTLVGAQFTALGADQVWRGQATPPEPDPDPEQGSIWPGAASFASAFGRLGSGQLSLLEIGPGVPSETVTLLLTPVVETALQKGGRVFLATPPTLDVEGLWSAIRSRLPMHRFLEGLRFYTAGRAAHVPSDLNPMLVELDRKGRQGDADPIERSLEFLRTGPVMPGSVQAAIAWHAGLRAMADASGVAYTRTTAPQIAGQYLNAGDVHLMIIGQNGEDEFRALGDMASTEIRVREKAGRIFFCGLRPRTPNLMLFGGGRSSPYSLVQMV